MALNWDNVNSQTINKKTNSGLNWDNVQTSQPTQPTQPQTFKTPEEALNYAKQNNINVSTVASIPQLVEPYKPNIQTAPTGLKAVGKTALQSVKSFGANALDATVDTAQFAKNAFKSEMRKDEREAIEGLIKLETGFRGAKNQISDEQAKTLADGIRKNYGLEGLTVEQLQNKLNGVIDWTYKENALEKGVSDLAQKVNEENNQLGTVGSKVANAFGTVGRMVPTIASNIALPGSGMPTMFASVAENQTENLMKQGVDYKDAVANGLLTGGLEVGTEMISGGISQGLTGIPALSKVGQYTQGINNKFVRGLVNIAGDITGEGLEEVASTIVQPFIDRATYNPEAPLATGKEMWSSFEESILPTLLMQGGSVAVQKVNDYYETQRNVIQNSNMESTAKQQMIQALTEQKNKISQQIQDLATQNNQNNQQVLSFSKPNQERITELESKLNEKSNVNVLSNNDGKYVSKKSISKNGNVTHIEYTDNQEEALIGKKSIAKVQEFANKRNIQLNQSNISVPKQISDFDRTNINNELEALQNGYNSYIEYKSELDKKASMEADNTIKELKNADSYLQSKASDLIYKANNEIYYDNKKIIDLLSDKLQKEYGGNVYHDSSKDIANPSNSIYLEGNGYNVRISDHDLPSNNQRDSIEYNPAYTSDIVLNDRMTKDLLKMNEQELNNWLEDKLGLENSTQSSFSLPKNPDYEAFLNPQPTQAEQQMAKEASDTLNMKPLQNKYIPKEKTTPKYKTNIERNGSIIERKIQEIENGEVERDTKAKTTSKKEIKGIIEDSLGKKIMTKGYRQRAYGIYKISKDLIRLAEESDVDTALHELGHQVDLKQLDNLSIKANVDVRNELIQLCEESFPNVYNTKQIQIEEGFAEATRNFIADKENFAKNYPETSRLILEQLEQNQNLNDLFTKLEEKVHDYINMTPEDRIGSHISFEEDNKIKIDVKKIKDTITEYVFDDSYRLKKIMNEVAKKNGTNWQDYDVNKNFVIKGRLSDGVQDSTIESLSNGYENEKGEKITKGLSEILKDFNNEEFKNLNEYMVAKGTQDYIKRDMKTGIRETDAKAVLEKFKGTKIEEADAEIRKINNYSLDRLLKNGLITKEQANTMKKINENYVPMNRVIDEEGTISRGKTSRKINSVLKGRKGSDKVIINPIESTIVNNIRYDKQIANNDFVKTFVKSLTENGLAGEYFDEVPAPMNFNGSVSLEVFKKSLEDQGIDTSDMDLSAVYNLFSPKLNDDKTQTISYLEDGKRKYIQIFDKNVYQAVVNLGKTGNKSVLGKAMKVFSNTLRNGATVLNAGFAIPNMISDSYTAYLNSDATYIPVVDSVIGIFDTLGGGEHEKAQKFISIIAPKYVENKQNLYRQYKLSGGKSETNRTGLANRKNTKSLVKEATGLNGKTLYDERGIWSAVKNGSTKIKNGLEYASDLSEEATRFRNFEKEVKQYKKQGMSEAEAIKKAGYNATRVTQDFSQGGKLTREVNQIVPFYMSKVGGINQFTENLKRNPKRMVGRIGILVAYTAAQQVIKNLIHPKDKNKEELQDQKRLDNYTFTTGTNEIVTVKKMQGPVRLLINLTETAVDYVMNEIDEKEAKRQLGAIAKDTASDMGLNPTDLVPQPIKPLVENKLNTDFYYGNKIVPDSMTYLDPKDQYDENTSETAKLIGKIINYSPAKIDNAIDGYFAGLGTIATDFIDKFIPTENEKKEKTKSESELTKRFFADTNKNSQSVSSIYDRLDELKNDKEYDRLTKEEEQEYEALLQAQKALSSINKQIKNVKNNSEMTGKEKKEKVSELQEIRTDTARYYLGKELIDTNNEFDAIYNSLTDAVKEDYNEANKVGIDIKSFYKIYNDLKKIKENEETTDERKNAMKEYLADTELTSEQKKQMYGAFYSVKKESF